MSVQLTIPATTNGLAVTAFIREVIKADNLKKKGVAVSDGHLFDETSLFEAARKIDAVLSTTWRF